jgi:hypothetical protein
MWLRHAAPHCASAAAPYGAAARKESRAAGISRRDKRRRQSDRQKDAGNLSVQHLLMLLKSRDGLGAGVEDVGREGAVATHVVVAGWSVPSDRTALAVGSRDAVASSPDTAPPLLLPPKYFGKTVGALCIARSGRRRSVPGREARPVNLAPTRSAQERDSLSAVIRAHVGRGARRRIDPSSGSPVKPAPLRRCVSPRSWSRTRALPADRPP